MPALATGHQPDGSIIYLGTGYGSEPCPTCGEQLKPGQRRQVDPTEWRPHHTDCWGPEFECDWCEERHPPPHDGKCLL